ncbi:MAG: PmoA family protein [Verrucomicrobia bacterium]|nr:PmoA family protein [Verrucomicrobiota bacterium]
MLPNLCAGSVTLDAVDIHLAGRLVGRYVTAHDVISPARLQQTYKPILQIMDAEVRQPITKAPGGEYAHHRDIYIGWKRMEFKGETFGCWHMIGGEQVVQGGVDIQEGRDSSTVASTVHWNAAGEPLLIEKRGLAFRPPPAPAITCHHPASSPPAPADSIPLPVLNPHPT